MVKFGPVVMASKIKDQKFKIDGTQVLELEYRAHKGKVFVFVMLGVLEPKDVTPEFIDKEIKRLAKIGFCYTDKTGIPAPKPKKKK